MTIELDTTLAQAEVLFLSFAQLVADVDRREAENLKSTVGNVRRRTNALESARQDSAEQVPIKRPTLNSDLRDLLKAGR